MPGNALSPIFRLIFLRRWGAGAQSAVLPPAPHRFGHFGQGRGDKNTGSL